MPDRESSEKSKLRCPHCGYNLTLLTGDRCPECGHSFVVAPAKTSVKKHPFRYVGEFFGHIWKGVQSDPGGKKQVLRQDVEEEKRGDVTLRRTTIEEIEIRDRRDEH